MADTKPTDMKKFYYLALCALIGVTLSSCFGPGNNNPEFKLSDLQGLWLENNTEHYVRFTTEMTGVEVFPSSYYGREWDEAEDVTEQDLIDAREELGYPGNGWFEYQFKTTGDLTEIHLMDNGGAEIPKIYIVSILNDGNLEYYEKDRPNWKYTFTKVVESK